MDAATALVPRILVSVACLLCAALVASGCGRLGARYEHPHVVNEKVHRGSEALAFDPASGMMASGGWEGEVALWSLPDRAPLRVWTAHESAIHGLGFAGTGLITASQDGELVLWSRDGARQRVVESGVPLTRASVFGGRLISGHTDGSVRVWRLPALEAEAHHALHAGSVTAVTGHSGTGFMASAGRDGRVFVWKADGEPRLLDAPPVDAWSLDFSPRGDTLFGGGWFRVFRWDVASGRLAVVKTRHWGLIAGLQYVPQDDVLASISRVNDSSVYFLDPATGATVRTFTPQGLCGGAIRVSGDGRYLATTGDDGAVRIWDLSAASSPNEKISRRMNQP